VSLKCKFGEREKVGVLLVTDIQTLWNFSFLVVRENALVHILFKQNLPDMKMKVDRTSDT
jgi:hypothetical protein